MLKKIIITNVLSQYISQFGLLSIQLFIFAYLSKVLSIENFGKLSFLLTINSIFFIIADFGFSWSTSRKISSIKDNKILSSEVFMTAWASQILITVIIFIINIIAMNLFNIADIPNNILVYSLGIFIGQILFPTWLLNCIDKINVILMIQFVSKILPAPLLFYYANNENDLYSSIIFLSVTNIFSGILFILYALIYMQIYWKLPKINEIINTLLEGKNIFKAKLLVSIYTLIIPVILLYTTDPTNLAYYNISDKIKNTIAAITGPISIALYPKMNYLANVNLNQFYSYLIKTIIVNVLILTPFCFIAFFYSSEIIIFISNDKYLNSSLILQWLSFIPLFMSITNILGMQFLLPLYKERIFILIHGVGCYLALILSLILIPYHKEIGAAIILFIVEIGIMTSLMIYTYNFYFRYQKS